MLLLWKNWFYFASTKKYFRVLHIKWVFQICVTLDNSFNFIDSGLKKPKIKPFNFSDDLEEGLRTGVICMVTDGDPPFEFQWSKDGHSLTTDNKGISIRKMDDFTSFLTIERLDADSNGNYTCRVSNAQGNDQKSNTLSMRGKHL